MFRFHILPLMMEFGKSVLEAENKTWEITDRDLSIVRYRNAGYMSERHED